MFLDDVEKKLDSLDVDLLDVKAVHARSIAKMGIQRMREQINLPVRIDIWNGNYSCPTCGKLFGPVSLCTDEYKKEIMPRCDSCSQMIDWDLEEKKDFMTLLSLKEVVDGCCEAISNQKNPNDVPVIVNLKEPSLGATAGATITSAHMGFDWEAGQFRLSTKEDIVHSAMKRDNPKKIHVATYGKETSYWCPNCSTQVSEKDCYCKRCGQKLENERE